MRSALYPEIVFCSNVETDGLPFGDAATVGNTERVRGFLLRADVRPATKESTLDATTPITILAIAL
jgi:hypothetical protein